MSHADNKIELFLPPGGCLVSDAAHRVCTLLGSCVSITLWHPVRRIGAMSHFLLSSRNAKPQAELDGRYGEEALSMMLRELERRAVPPEECQAKIFGGGNMFPGQPSGLDVGRANGETARRLLRLHGIGIVSESLFGIGHRQIMFDVGSGDVLVRQVKPVGIDEMTSRQKASERLPALRRLASQEIDT